MIDPMFNTRVTYIENQLYTFELDFINYLDFVLRMYCIILALEKIKKIRIITLTTSTLYIS